MHRPVLNKEMKTLISNLPKTKALDTDGCNSELNQIFNEQYSLPTLIYMCGVPAFKLTQSIQKDETRASITQRSKTMVTQEREVIDSLLK